jgi:hypothetical protein
VTSVDGFFISVVVRGLLIQVVPGRVRILGSELAENRCEAVVNVGGGVQTDAGMAVIVVVTINEVGHECPRGADGAESFRETGAYFRS